MIFITPGVADLTPGPGGLSSEATAGISVGVLLGVLILLIIIILVSFLILVHVRKHQHRHKGKRHSYVEYKAFFFNYYYMNICRESLACGIKFRHLWTSESS